MKFIFDGTVCMCEYKEESGMLTTSQEFHYGYTRLKEWKYTEKDGSAMGCVCSARGLVKL